MFFFFSYERISSRKLLTHLSKEKHSVAICPANVCPANVWSVRPRRLQAVCNAVSPTVLRPLRAGVVESYHYTNIKLSALLLLPGMVVGTKWHPGLKISFGDIRQKRARFREQKCGRDESWFLTLCKDDRYKAFYIPSFEQLPKSSCHPFLHKKSSNCAFDSELFVCRWYVLGLYRMLYLQHQGYSTLCKLVNTFELNSYLELYLQH